MANTTIETTNPLNIQAIANQSPVATDDTIAGRHAGLLYIRPEALLANDYDIDGDDIKGVSLQNAVNGQVYWNGSEVVFVGTPGYEGPASFEYTISDGQGGHASATVNLDVYVNTAPTAVDDIVTGISNTAVVMSRDSLMGNDFDSDGDAIEGVSIQDAVNGTVSYDGENVTFIPTDGYSGEASFTYTIRDSKGETSTATVNLTIEQPVDIVEAAPIAADDSFIKPMNEAIILSTQSLMQNDTDINGDALHGVSLQDAVNGTVSYQDSNVIFVPNDGYTGPASFTYTITDNKGGFSTATVNLTIVAPFDAVDDNVLSQADGAIELTYHSLTTNDITSDFSERSIISVQDAMNGSVSLSLEDRTIRFTPTEDYIGKASFTYTLQNNNGETRTATVNIDVEAPSNTINQTLLSDDIGDEVTFNSGNFDLKDSYATNYHTYDENHLTYSTKINGNMFGFSIYNVVQIEDHFIGEASLNYSVSTYYKDYDIFASNVIYNVIKNFDPIANDDALNVITNTQLLTPISTLLANDSDPENQNISLISVQDATHGNVAIVNDYITFTPTQGYIGEASYTYTIEDNRGLSNTATVNLNIQQGANTFGDENETNQFDEGGSLQVLNGEVGDLLNNATGDNPTIIGFRLPNDLRTYTADTKHKIWLENDFYGSLTINADGSYQIDSSHPDFFGQLPDIVYIVSDDNGAITTSTLSLTLDPINDAPFASEIFNLANIPNHFGQSVISSSTLLEKYVGDVDSDEVTVTSVQDATNGTVSLVDGEVIFTPTAGYTGPATFTYTVSDNHGATATASASLNVLAEPIVDTMNDTVTSTLTDVITIPGSMLLANDAVSSNFISVIENVKNAVNGTVSFDGEFITFTPNAGYTGPASFDYTVMNEEVRDTATVNLTIGAPSDIAPLVAQDDYFDISFGQPFDLFSSTLDNNDQISNELSGRAKLFNAESGYLELDYGNIFTSPHYEFTPMSGGTPSVEYAISDNQGNISTAKIHFNLPDDPTPIGKTETIFTLSDSIEINHRHLLNNDIDPLAQDLNIVSVQNDVNGTSALLDNSVTFNADVAASSEWAGFQYSISNGSEYHFAQVNVNVEDNFVTIFGSEQDDIFLGGAEDDVIHAQAGNDTLIGGAGNDSLYGGKGSDTFVWNANDLGAVKLEVDNVGEFELDKDKLDFKDFFSDANADNLSQLLVIDRVNQHTEIQVRTDVDQTDPSLLVILQYTDLSNGDTLSSEQMVANLFNNDNLIID